MPSYNSQPITLTLPGFHGMVRRLVLANVIIFFALGLLSLVAPVLASALLNIFTLQPAMVVHNFSLWQLVSYSFLNLGILAIAFNMLTVWLLGARLEEDYGPQWFGEMYFFSLIAAAVCTTGIAFLHSPFWSPQETLLSASSAIFGLMGAFGVKYGEQEIYLLVLRMKVKYMVAIFVLLSFAGLIFSPGKLSYIADLFGCLMGYTYAKFAPRRGYGLNFSEGLYGVRNAWYRRKRQKAAKKFEVYISKQDKSARISDPDAKRNPNDRTWMN